MKIVNSKDDGKVAFGTLDKGQCFSYGNNLLIKTNGNQNAVCLQDGEEYNKMRGVYVIPINAEVRIII